MKKIIIIAIIVIFAAGAGFAWSNREQTDSTNGTPASTDESVGESGPGATGPEADEVIEIDIDDFAFAPSDITIPAGTTVTWTNQDDVAHDVTPDEADAFVKSPLLEQGQSYSYTFETPGTYSYHCTPHPNMTASITVTE